MLHNHQSNASGESNKSCNNFWFLTNISNSLKNRRWENNLGRAGGKIILAGGKIILAGGKIILSGRKIILASLVTTRQSHPVRARKFMNNGMWGVYSPGLVTTRRSSLWLWWLCRRFCWWWQKHDTGNDNNLIHITGGSGYMDTMTLWWISYFVTKGPL